MGLNNSLAFRQSLCEVKWGIPQNRYMCTAEELDEIQMSLKGVKSVEFSSDILTHLHASWFFLFH